MAIIPLNVLEIVVLGFCCQALSVLLVILQRFACDAPNAKPIVFVNRLHMIPAWSKTQRLSFHTFMGVEKSLAEMP